MRSRDKARTLGPESREDLCLLLHIRCADPTALKHKLSQKTVDMADGHMETDKVTGLWALGPEQFPELAIARASFKPGDVLFL